MPRNERRPPRGLNRKTETLQLPPALVFICEGATEGTLLKELRQHWRIASASVDILPEAGDPGKVIEKAVERRAQGTSVWAVFDRDEHERWSMAVDRARSAGILLALSNPCVELYGILLHADQMSHIERGPAQDRLRDLHAGYHHRRNPYLKIDVVVANLEVAADRAARLDRAAADAGDSLRNPTTGVPKAVEALRSLAK